MVLTFMSRILMTLTFATPVLMNYLVPFRLTSLRGKRLPGPMYKSLQHRSQVKQAQV